MFAVFSILIRSQSRSVEEKELGTGISVDHSGPERSFRSNHSTHSITRSITPASVPSLAAPHRYYHIVYICHILETEF